MPDNKRIKFSFNWNNKLECTFFTTLRFYDPIKYQVGHTYDVYLKNKFLGEAELINLRKVHHDQINEFIAGIDTGYSVEETKNILERMYKGKVWLGFILLKMVRRPLDE